MFKNLNRRSSIGISLNRIYFTLCIFLIGTCSSVFAIDMSQAFSQANEQTTWISALFKWKATVSNLYAKALKLAKDRELGATNFSFDQLKSYFSTCPHVETTDFVNILYHSNSSFRNTFALILPPSTKKPTKDQIDTSYTKFFTCKNIAKPTRTDVENVYNEINRIYYDIYTTTYAMSTLNKSNFGSDLFWNGTLDDSDFDVLYDINQIGKLLFDDFKESPQILFYRLPASPTVAGDWSSSSSTPNSYQLWGGGSSFPGTSWVPVWWTTTPSPSWWWSSSFVPSTTKTTVTTTTTIPSSKLSLSTSKPSPVIDSEVQSFIESTNPSPVSSTFGAAALLFWNQCLSWDILPPPATEEQVPLMTPEEYLSGIVTFITTANIDDVINTNLLTQFIANNPLPSGWTTSDPEYAEAVANAYAEQALGEAAPGTCEYGCKDLALDKQVQCELSCAKSCIQKCDGLWLQDKLLCVSDCTCFLIAWPNGKWWEKMEAMFRIKFCKVPVQQKTIRPWKTVFSIQGIFQEISDVLAWLRDSGQMVKFSKTKEFLDSNIKIKFADNFAFKLQVWLKPVFPQKSTTIKTQEQAQANADLNVAVLDMNADAPEADNYNKYIVVADPISNAAWSEPANSLEDVNENIKKFQTAAAAAQNAKLSGEVINAILTSYAQHVRVLFVQNMIEFLKDNQLFLQDLSESLLDINKMSLELKTRIENSK